MSKPEEIFRPDSKYVDNSVKVLPTVLLVAAAIMGIGSLSSLRMTEKAKRIRRKTGSILVK